MYSAVAKGLNEFVENWKELIKKETDAYIALFFYGSKNETYHIHTILKPEMDIHPRLEGNDSYKL